MKAIKALMVYTILVFVCLQNNSCKKDNELQPDANTYEKPPEANWEIRLPASRPANFVYLDATAAFSVNGRIARYNWSKVSGPASYNIENPDSAVTKVGNLEEGVYQFKLVVTDNTGLSSDSIKGIDVVDHVQFILMDYKTLIFTGLKKENDPVNHINFMRTAPIPNGYDPEKIKAVLVFGGIGALLPDKGSLQWFQIAKGGSNKYVAYYKVENNSIVAYEYYDVSPFGSFYFIANELKVLFD
ncbi:hypothetical protein OCK74_22330 [Chitinophagaceae bacterium LB-8]|jgi:K319-like protein|uniref:PKD domain-containing protein n=1 Tax=Paraflavisolibacter caeni TaxID=2982496 RepID=A0A9X3BH34_9BACT|nr:hypothetical protein [Paraflavisolibacter caeni]MCU7551874.1 hypothetical protein [Paraflavisolibacter caeni]